MILVHSGNRIDAPDRTPARFPAEREEDVGRRLGELLDLLEPDGVVTAAAGGADLLLAEAAIKRSVPLHLVLPCDVELFEKISVADQGERWSAAYGAVLDHRCSLVVLGLEPDQDGFLRTNQALIERALEFDRAVLAVAVRPPPCGDAGSVTDDFVDRAHGSGLFVVEIDPRPEERS